MEANLKCNWRSVYGLAVLATWTVMPCLGSARAEVTPIIKHQIDMSGWDEMNGLAQNLCDPSHLYVTCDNSPLGDVVVQIRSDVDEYVFVAYTDDVEAKGATFDGTYVWGIGITSPGGPEFRIRRWSADLTGLVIEWPIRPGSFGLAWDGEALWVSNNDQTLRRYDPDTLQEIPGSEIDLDFRPLDLAWKDGYLWVSDWTNVCIKKIDPSSGTVVETWSCPWSGVGYPGGLQWGTFGGEDVLWCADVIGTDQIYALTAGEPDLIPTLSVWGLIVLALLLVTLGKVYFGQRQPAVRE